jgi:peptidoglycan/LPS O-acetylase OafA/YrhL
LSLAAAGAFLRQPDWPAASFYLNTVVLEFFFGILIAKNFDRLKMSAPMAIGLVVFGFALLYLPQLALPQSTPRVVSGGLPAALMFIGFLNLEQVFRSHDRNWLLYFGDASYAIYLVHPIVARIPPAVLTHLGIYNGFFSILFSIALALAGGAVLHQFVEKPMTMRLKTMLAGKSRY